MRPAWAKWFCVAVASGPLAGALSGGASARAAPHVTPAEVLSVYQTPSLITEHASFSVWLEVASTANIQQVYFTFCQLTSPLCYLPITMAPHGTNWYMGSTLAMTGTPGWTWA